MGKTHTMSSAELEILTKSRDDPNIFFDYWFRKPGQTQGWQLDYNFTEDGKWQETMCMATQKFIVAICGISTGKTIGVVMSAAYHATLSQLFRFMNVAPTSWQSTLMYNSLLELAEGTPFEALITQKPQRPYPKIKIEFMVGKKKFSSMLEFMTLGEKGKGDNIFSYRGDWINIEEAGQIDDLGMVVTNLVTRLTGATAENRPYLGRLSLISNPWENPDLWQAYDNARLDNKYGLIFNIDTHMNKNTTDDQVAFALTMIPKELHARFMSGQRPEGRGTYFSTETVEKCESTTLSQMFLEHINNKEDGYEMDSLPHLGTFYMKQQRKDGRIYFILGDPGTGTAPSRNAPCLICYDVTDAPNNVNVVAFWWGNGDGSIMPFVARLLEWIDYYKPIFAGVDNTGPQKSTAELITVDHISGKNKSVSYITGLDFSGSKRYSYLVACRLSLEARMIQWPHILSGISIQLKNYDPIVDKATGRLAQDVVATMAMGAFAIRAYYGVFEPEGSGENEPDDPTIYNHRRSDRDSIKERRGRGDNTQRANLTR